MGQGSVLGRPHRVPLGYNFILLHFIVLPRYCVFYKLKVCGNPVSSKSISAIFPTPFAHFVSLSHFGNSCNISNFSLLLSLLW